MAIVKPFKGLRFCKKASDIKQLVCPPYDIISEEERKAFLQTNSHNVIRLELPREGEDVYKKADEILNNWLEDGIVATEDENKFYIYEEEFKINGSFKSLKGIIARVKLADFDEGVVIPHENTLSAAKEDRFNLMCATGCNFSQVYCLFDDKNSDITKIINNSVKNPAVYDFSDKNGITHRLWSLDENCGISELFKDKCLYIADGHHRYETALRYRNHMRKITNSKNSASEYVMMMLVPLQCEGLVVFPTHRIVKNLPNFNGDELIKKSSEYFQISELSSPAEFEKVLNEKYSAEKVAFGAYFSNKSYLFTLKDNLNLKDIFENTDKTLSDLDVTVLHTLILEQILGIDKENMAKQINLTYTRDIAEASNSVDNGANCAFLLNPTRVEQIVAVGDAGQKMPQKSTYFYPKLITGLVMNKIN